MTAPNQNQQIVGQGLARLTSAFITQPNIRAMLAVYLQPLQDAEYAVWGVIEDRILSTAALYSLPQTNIIFDTYGGLLGVPRVGLSDINYKALLYLQIAVNRSTAATPNWSTFASILKPFVDAVYYLDGQASLDFGLWNMQLPPLTVCSQLTRAVGNGIGGVFSYSTWSDGNDFQCTSSYNSTAGEAGWGSVYDTTAGGLMVAGAPL